MSAQVQVKVRARSSDLALRSILFVWDAYLRRPVCVPWGWSCVFVLKAPFHLERRTQRIAVMVSVIPVSWPVSVLRYYNHDEVRMTLICQITWTSEIRWSARVGTVWSNFNRSTVPVSSSISRSWICRWLGSSAPRLDRLHASTLPNSGSID